MDKFYIITNSDKDKDLEFTGQIVEYLKANGRKCMVQQAERKQEGAYHYTNPALIPEDTECILVLGGDGTLLQAARDVVHREISMLGVNLGTLGFLAEVDKQSVYSALDKLMEDDYEIEERMMLTGTVWRDGKIIGRDVALNDIVIGRDGHLRVVRFKNYVNDVYLNSYNADVCLLDHFQSGKKSVDSTHAHIKDTLYVSSEVFRSLCRFLCNRDIGCTCGTDCDLADVLFVLLFDFDDV